VAIYYAIGGITAIIRIGFLQGIITVIGSMLLYGGLLSAGGGAQIWERIPSAVTSMDGYSIPWMTTLGMAFSKAWDFWRCPTC
jgi:sodium/pantothenate symporter